ncbi:coxsackievirus and adenovirus receptor homolog [Oreochromis niloticus]|uniref:coxsackievirus and adenovirus receptor homolog n=1 Tax=Oreochromis niloticus TaxID=8128 RepID=UPI000DF428B5|nr:coxsackievirus and adenovirus receptor homolog [Oreochromis niloticus]
MKARMVGIKTASLWTLLFICLLAAAGQVQKTITAESGDTVTLPCRAPNNRHITVVDWRRSDLTDKSVLLYRDNKIVSNEQDPSFKNRVALQDVKDGDVSLILKNVTTHDTGIYECRVVQQTESHRRKRAVDPISSNYLRVVQKTITAESGDTVTLPCRAPNNRHITVVDWRRSGLTDKSVLLYWDNKIVSDEQDPSFKNRVALQDVKDGDVSLILKNVTTHDTGIYECRVDQQTESHRRKRAVDPISSTYLRVVQKTITAESGDTVTLPCRAPNNRHITVVDWRRSGLTDKSVLLYRDNKYDPDEQDPSFKNRVALQDVKDGDVSLILKNVTTHDTGIYECRVDQQTESHRRKRAVDPISSTYLRVGQTGGHTEDGSVGRKVTLSVSAVLRLAAVVGLLSYIKHKQQNQDPYQPPAEQQQL